jgi:peptidoglycan/xylan/chitin deacetylase (PgdA/CDA1 family)
MLDAAFVLVLTAALAAALWFLQRRLFGAAGTRPRTALRLAAVVVVALALVAAGSYQLSKPREVQLLGELATRVDTSDKVVALTFDDGPEAEYVAPVLEILRRHDAKATSFIIGAAVEASPQSLRTMVRAGHEIGNHTYSHPRLLLMSQGAIGREIETTDALIRAAGYDGPIHVRPPNCKRLLAAAYYLWRHGRTTVTWDLEPDSMSELAGDPAAMTRYVRENVHPGSIILLHVMYEGREASRDALPWISTRSTPTATAS